MLSNKPSKILNDEQNAAVFKMLQPNCKTLATSVVVLFSGKVKDKWEYQEFGVLCIELDTTKNTYFLRFYTKCFTDSPKIDLQEKVTTAGKPFKIVRDQVFEMKIHNDFISLQFPHGPEGYEDSTGFAKALRGNLNSLKREAELRYLEEHPDELKAASDKVGPFKKVIRWMKRKEENEEPKKITAKDISGPTNFQHVQHLGIKDGKIVTMDWAHDSFFKTMLTNMGLELEKVLRSSAACQKIEDLIKNHGGLEKFRNDSLQNGYGLQGVQEPQPPQQETPLKGVQEPKSPQQDTPLKGVQEPKSPQHRTPVQDVQEPKSPQLRTPVQDVQEPKSPQLRTPVQGVQEPKSPQQRTPVQGVQEPPSPQQRTPVQGVQEPQSPQQRTPLRGVQEPWSPPLHSTPRRDVQEPWSPQQRTPLHGVQDTQSPQQGTPLKCVQDTQSPQQRTPLKSVQEPLSPEQRTPLKSVQEPQSPEQRTPVRGVQEPPSPPHSTPRRDVQESQPWEATRTVSSESKNRQQAITEDVENVPFHSTYSYEDLVDQTCDCSDCWFTQSDKSELSKLLEEPEEKPEEQTKPPSPVKKVRVLMNQPPGVTSYGFTAELLQARFRILGRGPDPPHSPTKKDRPMTSELNKTFDEVQSLTNAAEQARRKNRGKKTRMDAATSSDSG